MIFIPSLLAEIRGIALKIKAKMKGFLKLNIFPQKRLQKWLKKEIKGNKSDQVSLHYGERKSKYQTSRSS